MAKPCPTCAGLGVEITAENVRDWLSAVRKQEEEQREAYYNRPDVKVKIEESRRRTSLPPEHPDHTCGMMCDGQDGQSSNCYKIRMKLFGRWHDY